MAQSFDATKATSDLKQLLNLSQLQNTHSVGSSSNTDNIRKKSESENTNVDSTKNQMDHVATESNKKDLSISAKVPFKQKRLDSKPMNGDKSRKQKQKHTGKVTEKPSNPPANKFSQEERGKKEKDQFSRTSMGSPKPQGEIKSSRTQASSSSARKDTPTTMASQRDGIDGYMESSQNMKGEGRANQKMTNSENSNQVNAKNLWDNLSREMQLKMDQNKIFFLKKKNMRFPNAKYFCRLCEYHMDSVEICEKHMEDSRHCHRKDVNDMDSTLRNFPPPMSNHIEAITAAIEDLYSEDGLKQQDREIRRCIVQRLEEQFQKKIPDVKLHMYGTSLTCMGLKAADINVNLHSSAKDTKLTTLLKEAYNLMKDRTDTGFINVHSDFSATVPALLLTDSETGYKLTVTIHFYSALCTSELLSIYSDFDDRVAKLAVAFRYWAYLCGVDRHQVGFIPPIALNIMVVFFLQTVKPQVLPIISPPMVCGEDTGDFTKDKPSFQLKRNKAMKVKPDLNNSMSVGELWVQLLKFYSIELDIPNTVISIRSARSIPRTTKPWNSKKLAVEDPFSLKKNLTRMLSQSYEYWQYTIRKAYHYFGLPRGSDGKSYLPNYDFPDENEDVNESSKNKSSVKGNELSSTDEKTSKDEVTNCVESSQVPVVDKEDTCTVNSNDHTEDHTIEHDSPATCSDPKQDLDTTLSKVKSGEVSPLNVDKNSTTKSTPTETVISSDPNSSTDKSSSPADETIVNNELECDNSIISSFALDIVNSIVKKAIDLVSQDKSTSPSVSATESDPSKTTDTDDKDEENLATPNASQLDQETSTPEDKISSKHDGSSEESKNNKNEKYSFVAQIASKECSFQFSKEHFASKKEPTLICTSCEKEGHHKNECPDDELPEILPIQGFTEHHHKVLEETLKKIPSEVGLSDASINQRQLLLRCLEDYIQMGFPGARLQLFGSSCNGFGFDRSDMDICMTFVKKKLNIDKVYCVERLASMLKLHKDLKNVQSIPTAKVPIVKFSIKDNDLDGDISLYNTLAQENTRLLYSYSEIDPRVQVLGYAIKLYAQVCDIGDASRGSLSSYAYILMMLYYLQQVQPPVIPVLQELHQTKEKPKNVVEGWDAWFMGDMKKLKELWPEKGKNKMSVSELWLGFLRFYVEEFNYRELVISIRQKEPLTRFEKLWNGFCLAIEDPFDLNHNLGSGLSRTMNAFILKTFINGRMLYGSPIDDNMELFNKYQSASDYFFDTELLSEARPPNARGCRHCGKIGHMMRHCPTHKKEKDDEHQRQQQHRQQQRHLQDQQRQQPNQKSEQQRQHHHYPQQQDQAQRLQDPQQVVRKKQESPGQHVLKQHQQHAQRQNKPQQQQQYQNKQHQMLSKPQQQQQQNDTPRQQSRPRQQQYTNSNKKQQSFQQQKQHEAQQLQKQLEREWFSDRGREKESAQESWHPGKSHNYNVGQLLSSLEATARTPSVLLLSDSPSLAPSTSLPSNITDRAPITSMTTRQYLGLPLFATAPPQFNVTNNPSVRPPVTQSMNQRQPLPDLMRMNFQQRFPPSLIPPVQRPRGLLNNQFPLYMGPPPPPPPPRGHSSPYYYNYNFNNSSSNTYNFNNSGNNTGANNSNNNTDPNIQRIAMMPPQNYSNIPASESPHSSAPAFLPHSAPPTNAQGLNPVVQNLFASTQGKVLDARAMNPHLMKRNN